MFEKISAYLEKRLEANTINPDPFERRQVAVAALLIEASRLDGHYSATEQGTIARLLRETLHLPAEQARILVELAEIRQANTYDNWIFCQSIKRGFSKPEQLEILGKLWQIILSDGQLHRLEAMMFESVANELGVTPQELAALKST